MLSLKQFRPSALMRDQNGNALIEFTYTLPIMLSLFFGAITFGDAIVLQRKVTNATRALADLTTQGYSLSSPGFTTATLTSNVFQGAAMILYPYDISKSTLTVSDYCEDKTGKITVMWSEYYVPGAPPTANPVNNPVAPSISTNILPTPVATASNPNPTSCITRSDINYSYTPYIGNSWIPPFTISDHIYMTGRNYPDIPFTP